MKANAVKYLAVVAAILVLLAACVSAPPAKSKVTDDPATINYVRRMKEAAGQQGWCKVYFHSFNDTRHSNYLRLAVDHCVVAIKNFHTIQFQLSPYTTFHYDARRKRLQSCSFYDQLTVVAQERQITIPSVSSSLCSL